jgi:hypothetical protein
VTPWKKPSAPWSASSACTKAIPFEIILQRPKDTAALLRRLSHAPANKIAAAKEGLTAAELLEFCPLETLSRQNHTAVVGESGSEKSLLTKYLIHSYFREGMCGSMTAVPRLGSGEHLTPRGGPGTMRRSPRTWPKTSRN